MVRTWFLSDRVLGACLAAALGAHAFGQSVVVPNGNATVVGGQTSGPLPSTAISGEFQLLLGSGQFSALPGPVYITGFTWRAAPGLGPLSVTISGSVSLSTSPNYPNTNGGGKTLMSTTFANNVGQDVKQVFSGNNVTLSGAGCAGPVPCPWANNIVPTAPFLYNPGFGPLLIDLKFTSFAGSGQFDVIGCSAPGCSVASVGGGPLGTPTGSFSYGGNITQVTYTPVPFFTSAVPLNNGVYYMQFPNANLFGYYTFVGTSVLFHYDLGYEAFIPGSGADTYLYDFATTHWFYTSAALFPFLYDFTLKTWIYYFPDTKNPGHYTTNPRYFSNLTTSQVFTM